MKHHPLKSLFLITLIVCLVHAQGPDNHDDPSIITGRRKLYFQERHPLGMFKSLTDRYHWRVGWPSGEERSYEAYDIQKETFSAYIPESYDGSEPFGLLVWVHPGNVGAPFDAYLPIFEKHRLIWIGGDRVGNTRNAMVRFGMSLDAVHNMTQRYRIDPERIYVAGFSGGGRVSSELVAVCSDIFQGGIFVMGCNFYQDLLIPPENFLFSGFCKQLSDELQAGWRNGRYALLTASEDMNLENTKTVFKAYKKEGIPYVTYHEIPDLGHVMPPADWLEECIASIERPLRIERALFPESILTDLLNAFPDLKQRVRPGESLKKIIRDLEDERESPDTARSEEAQRILSTIHAWIGRETDRCNDWVETRPAEAAFRLIRLDRSLKGLDAREDVQALLRPLKEDEAVMSLAKIRRKVDAFHRKLVDKGSDMNTMKTVRALNEDLESFLSDEISNILRAEAKALLRNL